MLINVDLIWPVYSIYFSTANVNPSEYFGGKWTLWGSGRVPVCVDTSQTEFNSSEKTGGSKATEKHRHGERLNDSRGGSSEYAIAGGGGSIVDGWWVNNDSSKGCIVSYHGEQNMTDYFGSGDSGNLQPYITCYMWKRIA